MVSPSKSPSADTPPPALPTPSYPVIESFIEVASYEEAQALFAPVRQELAALKGPRVDQAHKVEVALARAEELMKLLLDTRERLLEEARESSRGRR